MKKTFLIAEVAQAHDGSLGILHSYIDAIAGKGFDAIKFQTHIAEAESSRFEPFRMTFSFEDTSRFDYWKRMEFSLDQWRVIKKHCEEMELEFMSSPFSNAAIDLLEEVGVQRYKIGSGEINNFLLLEKIGRLNKEIILSSGMSSYQELDSAVDFLKLLNSRISILQCTTKYPTKPKEIGLNLIQEMKERYNCPVGLSDHSGTIYPSLAAVALGAEIIEIHITFDRKLFGPDAKASITIDELEKLVKGIRFLDEAMSSPVDKNEYFDFTELKKIFGKSLAVNRDMKAGDVITFNDLEGKKPLGKGFDAQDFKEVVGKKLNKNLKKWDFLKQEDIG